MDLDRLIETERRLDEALQRARGQAAEMIRAAEEAARQREAELEAELAAAARSFEAELAGERERGEREIAERAQGVVERYAGISDERIRAAAAQVVRRLGGGATS